ncbi:MAG: hypothetical protein FJY55_07715 [Betaproteobacteria bacterium]|nr:hypothetical protein [Betaproteobacteria bacterium]
MKALFVFTIALFAANPVAQAQTSTQTPAQKAAPKAAAKAAAKPAPTAPVLTASCQMDSCRVADKTLWCDDGRVLQCNASNSTWINTGKRC